MLAKEVFAVVVAVGGADDDVDVVVVGELRVFREGAEAGGALVVEFD